MANPSSGVYVTQDGNRKQNREDLSDVIRDLSPQETPVYQTLAKTKATNVYHEFNQISVARSSGISASTEGQDDEFVNLTTPTRNVNYVEEITKTYKISYVQQATNTVGGNQMAQERVRAMKAWKTAFEYDLIWGSGVSGTSGGARVMKGILNALAKVTNASGATLTEKYFNDFVQGIWNDVTDDTYSAYFDMRLKRQVSSAFTATTTRFTEADKQALNAKISVYESDVAKMIELYGHRDLNGSARMFMIQPKAFSIAIMTAPKDIDIASRGNWEAGKIYGSGTLEYGFDKAGISVSNLAV